MRSTQHSPLWPYLLVLAGLFVLSVAVPRGWRDSNREAGKSEASAPRAVSRGAADSRPPVARPAVESLAEAIDPVVETLDPLVEKMADKVAGLRKFLSRTAANHDRRAAEPVATSAPQAGPALPSIQRAATLPALQQESELETAYWPVPQSLIDQLDCVAQSPATLAWAAQAEELCVALCRTPPGDFAQARERLRQLKLLVGRADAILPQVEDPQAAADLRRAKYALERRLLVWDVALTTTPRKEVFANVADGESRRQALKDTITEVGAVLAPVTYNSSWRNYLRLDEVSRLVEGAHRVSRDEAAQIARTTLTRMEPQEPTAEQREILGNPALIKLAGELRRWAAEPVAPHEVLDAIERYESGRLESDGKQIVWSGDQLKWSADERDRELARHIDSHYRNANVRIVLTDDFLNRMMPQPTAVAGNVDDTVLGNPVVGSSVTSTRLQVRLIPDPRRVHLWVEAVGNVDSRTRAFSGPATFRNQGEATYVARKAVLLDRQGVGVAHTVSEADSDAWLTGVSTDYDGIPLLGRLARNYAVSQHDALEADARREVITKVATKAGQQLHSEVDRRVAEAEARVRKQWLDPLANMGLELAPITLETAAERVTMRLRMAGRNQPGGHTARPQAPSDSLASVQLHESAINNFMEELQLAGKSFLLPDLYTHLSRRTSHSLTLPEDVPDDVVIRFAEKNPIRVRCHDGVVQLTLAIDELRQGSRMWHDFLISTTYSPEVDGRRARLVRDGAIRLGGETYKGQTEVVLRGIFSKILSRDRAMELVPALVVDHPRLGDVAVTQCLIEDGWVGLALGPNRTARQWPPTLNPATAARPELAR